MFHTDLSPEERGYLWKKSTRDSPSQPASPSSSVSPPSWITFSRQLTNLERMFEIFNRDLYGQNCPFMGAKVSVQPQESQPGSPLFSLSQLADRAIEAFCQTRWKYPTIAARIDGDRAVYKVEDKEEVSSWARRVVSTVSQAGGWEKMRERVSREVQLPTIDGDYCTIYIILQPFETSQRQLTTFDVLLHTHHAFTDGAGIRSILDEFLARLTQPLQQGEISWGRETDRLAPPSILLAKNEELEGGMTPVADSGVRLKGFAKPDIGLPVYKPEIGPPKPEHRGTLLVSHTFDKNFLPQLLAVGRRHGVKLAAVLHAALLQIVHELSDDVPGSDDLYKSGSALDLRNGWMISPYSECKAYVNSAIAIHPIEVPCLYFSKNKVEKNGFWEAASFISGLWDNIKAKKSMAKSVEADAGAFITSWENRSASSGTAPSKPRTCPYFVSDPPGSQILSSTFPVFGFPGLLLVLESYQLATDQTQAVISARSHSWNNKLTLCLVFNEARNPREKMEEALAKWVEVIQVIKEDI